MEKGVNSSPVKNLLDALHLTPAKFCRETTVAPGLLSNILSGKRPVTSDFVLRVVRRFTNVNIEYLLGESDVMFVNHENCDSIQKELDACKLEVLRLKAELYDLSRK